MVSDDTFDAPYWNVSQACGWVQYREHGLVNDLRTADRNGYIALGLYPSMWPRGRKLRGTVEELRRALERGSLKASGYRHDQQGKLEEIPAAEWTDLELRPPNVCFSGQSRHEPWINVRFKSSDLKRLWRSPCEVSLRTKFDWHEIKTIHAEIERRQPTMSQNNKIEEVQLEFEARFNTPAPSRSSLQKHIKTWSQSATPQAKRAGQ